VHDFYARHIRPEGSVLAIVGDFELDAYENRWANMFRHWRNTSGRPQSAVSRPQLRAPQRTSVRLIDKPDFSQTSLLIGHPAPPELHADRNALALANYILGGGNFSSRLMARIRTRIGKTYGISSQLVCTHHFGIFLIGTSTQSGQLGEVLDAILEVYRNLGQNGVTAEELAKAQQFAVGNLAFQLEGIGNITEKLLWLRHFNRPVSYIENFDAIISNISLCEVNAAINRHLSSQHFIIAAVGKKAQIERQLLRFGKVRSFPFRALP
jgi:zinc protease